MMDANLDRRLAALESRLGRLEQLLGTLNGRLEATPPPGETKGAIQAWVTEYVSMRLQQLVPETCEHPEAEVVIETQPGYLVVEKIDQVGAKAEETDPRG